MIQNNIDIEGCKISYQIGKNGEWEEGCGKISILDYDITTSGLINEDETVTITAKVQDDYGNEVRNSNNFDIDTSSTLTSFEAESLLDAMEKYDFGNGKYNVTVLDERYSLRVYSFEGNQEFDSNIVFGTEKDVANKTENAQNMIVLKVNGDLTINPECVLTSYASSSGYGGPKGMMIYCTGNLNNNGTISMTARGAKAEGQNVYLWKNKEYEDNKSLYEYIPAQGASGGKAIDLNNDKSSNGNKGNDGILRQTGGRRNRRWTSLDKFTCLYSKRRSWYIIFWWMWFWCCKF